MQNYISPLFTVESLAMRNIVNKAREKFNLGRTVIVGHSAEVIYGISNNTKRVSVVCSSFNILGACNDGVITMKYGYYGTTTVVLSESYLYEISITSENNLSELIENSVHIENNMWYIGLNQAINDDLHIRALENLTNQYYAGDNQLMKYRAELKRTKQSHKHLSKRELYEENIDNTFEYGGKTYRKRDLIDLSKNLFTEAVKLSLFTNQFKKPIPPTELTINLSLNIPIIIIHDKEMNYYILDGLKRFKLAQYYNVSTIQAKIISEKELAKLDEV